MLFFPQMKPEVFGGKKGPELSDNEKVVLDILIKSKQMDLNELKEQSQLSNKQWDKSIKGLRNQGLVSVTKTESALIAELIN